MSLAVKVDNVSIRYLSGDFKDIGLKEFTIRKLTGKYQVKEFWANKAINFELKEGDMLGILGVNGAGKSTLLKAMAGIMVPTEGKVITNGNVVALLELGSGFDGDLTVKENTYLRGALLGYTKKFMDEKYKEIIEFAELEEFQDYLFKHLSSGMKSRLAFSIACLVDPNILILDEVLSVGDGAFRQKSGDRMRQILKNGVTGILVSHSLSQVRELCNKVLWLDHGKQVAFGNVVHITNAYEHFLNMQKDERIVPNPKDIKYISKRFQLFQCLSEKELVEASQDEKELLRNEPIEIKERRWMEKIEQMPLEKRKKLYDKYGI